MLATDRQLDYAPPLAWHRSGRVRRRILVLVVLVVLVFLAPRIYRHAQVLWWQERCLKHVAPARQIVYDDGSGAAAMIQQGIMTDVSRPSEERTRWLPSSTPPPVAARTVQCWDKFYELAGTGPAPSTRFGPALNGNSAGAMIYLHAARDAAGQSGLLAVAFNSRSGDRLYFDCWFLRYATPISSVGVRSNPYFIETARNTIRGPLRFYAGQAKAGDLTRFTFGYDLAGVPGTIEGRVDESGVVHLEVKDGPAFFQKID